MTEKVLIDLCHCPDPQGLILELPTGVVYTTKAAGAACERPRAEGSYVPFAVPFALPALLVNAGAMGEGLDAKTADRVDDVLHARGTHLRLDRSRLAEAKEAWLPVFFRDDKEGHWTNCKGRKAILTWANSD